MIVVWHFTVEVVAVNGKWHLPAKSKTIPDPYNGEEFVKIPDPQVRTCTGRQTPPTFVCWLNLPKQTDDLRLVAHV